MASSPRPGRRPATKFTAVLAALILLALAGVASAASATSAAGEDGKLRLNAGGATAPGTPSIKDVVCLNGCVGLRKATVDGKAQVSGRNLSSVTRMTFTGADGRITAPVTETTETTAQASIPEGTMTGKVRVKDDFGNASGLSPTRLEIRPKSELGSAGVLTLVEAETLPRKAYFFGVRTPRLSYVIGSNQLLNDLRIDVVDADGAVAKSFFRDDVEANTTQTIRWNGKASSGRPAKTGRYSFRVSAQTGEPARRDFARADSPLGFKLFGFIFPVRGPHEYGDGIGAPRSGHTHQGVDLFAACGTKMVAARGGRVQYAGYHGAAGNYIVIDGKSSGIDFAYMHLVSPAQFREGQMVRTGQKIGEVGESGNASGCHLHYEMWGPPGWYEGGSFLDPMPALKRWDRYS